MALLGWLGAVGLELFCGETRRDMSGVSQRMLSHLNANDLKLAYRALKKLHSKFISRVSVIQTADGCLISDADGQMSLWVEYFEQLSKVNPPSRQLQTTGLQALDADPPIN